MKRFRLSPKRLAGTTAVLGATALSLAGSTATQLAQASAHIATNSPCATSGLVIWLDTEGNGALGSIYYKLELTNLSGHTCTLHGFPGVSAVSLGGGQLGRAASRESTGKLKTVTLPNRATATALLRIVAAGNFPSSVCGQTMAAGLRVFPPGQTTSKVVPFPFEACSRSGPAYLSVRALRKG
jgi:hypothetical protein